MGPIIEVYHFGLLSVSSILRDSYPVESDHFAADEALPTHSPLYESTLRKWLILNSPALFALIFFL